MTTQLQPSTYTIAGPKCRNCGRSEQRCADLVLAGGCCGATCSHWLAYTDDGNIKAAPEHGHGNPSGVICGSEVGYQRHLHRRERVCQDCKIAHYRKKGWL